MSGRDTWDDCWSIEHESQTQTQPNEVNEFTKNTLYFDEQTLAEALQGVVLSNTQIHKNEEKEDGEVSEGGASDGTINGYPLRPYAENCTFYMKTGTCKFKLACKFNHPVNRANQGVTEKKGSVEQTANIECKYYLTPGGCRFGEACNFRHSMDQNRMEPPELNFLGLPIRLGEKTCPFYMRTGSCGYGEKCKFHHPDPGNLEASDPEIKARDNSPEKASDVWENNDNEPDLLPAFLASQPTAEPWAPHMIMRETAFYKGNHSHSLPEAVVSNGKQLSTEWDGYQTPTPSQEETEKTTLNIQVNDSLLKNVGPLYSFRKVQSEKFPERPGEPECDYYMKTGHCKFGSACRYHHPKNRSSRLHIGPLKDRDVNQKSFYGLEKIRQNVRVSDGYNLAEEVNALTYHQERQFGQFPDRPGHPVCSFFMKTGDCKFRSACRYHHPIDRHSTSCPLNAKGLPLRPGRSVCDHFKQYGICKFGRRCLFDHPEDLGSVNSLKGSNSNISSRTESPTV